MEPTGTGGGGVGVVGVVERVVVVVGGVVRVVGVVGGGGVRVVVVGGEVVVVGGGGYSVCVGLCGWVGWGGGGRGVGEGVGAHRPRIHPFNLTYLLFSTGLNAPMTWRLFHTASMEPTGNMPEAYVIMPNTTRASRMQPEQQQ